MCDTPHTKWPLLCLRCADLLWTTVPLFCTLVHRCNIVLVAHAKGHFLLIFQKEKRREERRREVKEAGRQCRRKGENNSEEKGVVKYIFHQCFTVKDMRVWGQRDHRQQEVEEDGHRNWAGWCRQGQEVRAGGWRCTHTGLADGTECYILDKVKALSGLHM